MTRCIGFGQIIDTAIKVPGTVEGNGAAVAGGISIAVASEASNTDAPLYERVNDTLIFSAPDVATYRCSADHIDIAPCPASDPEWVTALLIATALPASLWMQGRFMLHAAGIILKGSGRAIAIAGPSGSGKSTLVRQLLNEGAQLVGDDSLALEITCSGIIATGLPGGIHIRTGEGDDRRFEPIAPSNRRYPLRLTQSSYWASAPRHSPARCSAKPTQWSKSSRTSTDRAYRPR